MASAAPVPKNSSQLQYPFDSKPAAGASLPVADGVHWLRMPLPFSLNHINLWMIEDGDGLALVDTGLRGETTRELWRSVLEQHAPRRPSKLLITHMHPDHAGSGGWLCEEYGLTLHMTRLEYLTCRTLAADIAPPPPAATAYFRSAGMDEQQLAQYAKMFGSFGRGCDTLPASFKRLTAGDMLILGDQSWEVVGGNGHSPEHACFFNPQINTVISGDQLLPSISSNVSVWPTEPEANPLSDWLASCQHLIDVLPEDVLVLPSHGKPFRGAHSRARQLIAEHLGGLEKLRDLCRDPRRAIDVFPALFKARVPKDEFVMAIGESVAHLNYLIARDEMRSWLDDDQIRWYQTIH